MSALDRQEVIAADLAALEIDGEGLWQWALEAADQRTTEDAVILAVMEMLCALLRTFGLRKMHK